MSALSIAVALTDGEPGLLPELAMAGVTDVVLVGSPPAEPAAAATWVAELALHWDNAGHSDSGAG
jgi:hypothetical protein